MNNTMKGILSRVLSEEIENQKAWKEDEMMTWESDGLDRDKNIEIIQEFMKENDIPIYHRYY